MRRYLLLLTLILSGIVILPESSDAQIFGGRNKRRSGRGIGSFAGSKRLFNPQVAYYSIGGGINALNYFGDIAPTSSIASTDISFTRPGINLFLKQKFGDRYHWRVNFMWGRLSASDSSVVGADNFQQENTNRYLRNLDFRNDIYELSLSFQIDMFSHGGRYTSRAPLNIYLFGGVGLVFHNPKGKVPESFYSGAYRGAGSVRTPLPDAGEWVNLRPLGTEGQFFSPEIKDQYKELRNKDVPDPYSRFQLVLPVGIGARYKINNNIDINLEIGYRHTFTDYLDDVSGEYVNLSDFGDASNPEDALAMAMSDKSNQFDQTTFDLIREFTYTRRVNEYSQDGLVWRRAAGYGASSGNGNFSDTSNLRGSPDQNDIYIVTNLSVTYILGRSFVNGAKFR